MDYFGIGVSEGLSVAKLCLLSRAMPQPSSDPAKDITQELAEFEAVREAAFTELTSLYENAKQTIGEKEAEIFDAHLTLLTDEYSLIDPIRQRICEGKNCAAAIGIVFDELITMFSTMDDELMAARATDAWDLKRLLLCHAMGIVRRDLSKMDEDVILLAEELTPSDTVRMDTAHIKGLATHLGSTSSHTAIIARTLGIPAVVGLSGWELCVRDGEVALLDGTKGVLTVAPTKEQLAQYQQKKQEEQRLQEELKAYYALPTQTADGHTFELCANIGTPEEAAIAATFGADGIGLFRSEFLFMERNVLPSEDEQYLAYRRAVEALPGKPVIVRTLDVGGDKKLPFLNMPHEDNPFLGCRAIRMTLGHEEIFRPQLRALLRASAYGDLRIMFPMISHMQQLRAAKKLLCEEREALRANGIPVGNVKIGMMIEVPGAALMADRFAAEVDFFSIGTNDLTQYTLATERGNNAVSQLYTPCHPGVLALIEKTAQAAKRHNIPCGVCGETAGELPLADALIGMGVTELSVSPRKIPALRKHFSETKLESCVMKAEKFLCGDE